MRGCALGPGGYIHNVSSVTAHRYGSFATLNRSISSSLLKVARNSSVILVITWGLVAIRYVAPAKDVAVVSDPARVRMTALFMSSSPDNDETVTVIRPARSPNRYYQINHSTTEHSFNTGFSCPCHQNNPKGQQATYYSSACRALLLLL